MAEVSKYELLLLTFIGAMMAQSGCTKEQAIERIATLMEITERKLGLKVNLRG